MSYTDVFTGATLYPAEVNLTQLELTADVTLYWPQEAQPNQPVASNIIQIDAATADGWKIAMPDATRAGLGDTTLFNNLSSHTVIITDAIGTQLLTIASGEQWQIYLDDNSTTAGAWKVYQFGAGVSSANASALAGNGLKAIDTKLAQSIATINFAGNLTLTNADRAKFYNYMGSGAGYVVTLPDPGVVGNDWFVQLRNSGESSFTVLGPGIVEVDGLPLITFSIGDAATLVTDGLNYYSIGMGQDPVFAFDYAVVDVTGMTDYTLSGSELNRIAYEFIGVMGASFSVIVPPTVQQYWVYDNTSAGVYNLSIKTAAQITPLNLIRGDRVITYCTGTAVVPTSAAAVVGVINGGAF